MNDSKPKPADQSEIVTPDSPSAATDAAMIAGETTAPVGSATPEVPAPPPTAKQVGTGKHAFLVGAGILISRIVGLIRQRVFSYYFGLSSAGDAFSASGTARTETDKLEDVVSKPPQRVHRLYRHAGFDLYYVAPQ